MVRTLARLEPQCTIGKVADEVRFWNGVLLETAVQCLWPRCLT